MYLHEEDVACGICTSMHNKSLLLDVTASAGPDGKLAAILKTQMITNEQQRVTVLNSTGGEPVTMLASLSRISLISWLYVRPMWDFPIRRLTFFLMSFLFN